MNRWLIRFDVRAARDQYVTSRWSREARLRYLLRPDVEWPLSVDPRVWPSVFYSDLSISGDWQSYATIKVDLAVNDHHYWLNLDRMRALYDGQPTLAPGAVFVAIELLSEKDAQGETIFYKESGIQCGLVLEPTKPTRLPEGSVLLGYDVADATRISGLANTEYSEVELRDLAPAWENRLNSFGLIEKLEDAVAFRNICDDRDPGDAPFWIYALWRLPIAS